MAIEWTDEMSTGFEDIDKEHRAVYEQVNKLASATEAGAGEDERVAAQIVDALKAHVILHFAQEEERMRAASYTALEEHRAEHDEILEYVASFQEELSARGTNSEILTAATRVLGNWLITHTSTFDRDFAQFLRAQR